MARFQKNAKRANKPNPREDKNSNFNPKFFQNGRDNVYNLDGTSATKSTLKVPKPKKPFTLIPKTISQETYIDLLEDESKNYVICYGSAGTGKTFLCLSAVLRDLYEGKIGKIFLVRTLTPLAGESIGFLPGSKLDKILDFNIAYSDVLKTYFTDAQISKMLDDNIIEFCPPTFMRGRNLGGEESGGPCAVIIDEAQNANPEVLKSILSRLTYEGSRMYILGDTKQHDMKTKSCGLDDLLGRLQAIGGHENIATHQFFPCDSVRHPMTKFILNMYGEED